MTVVINPDSLVINSAKGNHFHLVDDCRGVMLGWTTHASQGNDVFTTYRLTGDAGMTYAQAVDSGLFGCKVCHKIVGAEVPAKCDRIKVRAARKAARALAKAAKAEANTMATVVETVPVVEVIDFEAKIVAMLAEIEAMLSMASA